MASTTKQNIFCVSCLVQGVQCPAKRRGKPCPMAHTIGEINPGKCNRGGGGGGEECRCKYRKYPFVCQFIHDGETKEKYSNRVGFDPKHEKYDHCSPVGIYKELDDCRDLVDELKKKISKFDLKNIPDKDRAYVRRTQNAIRHLSIKINWLTEIIKKMDDLKRQEPKKMTEEEWEKFRRQEAMEDRRDKYREQYREMMYDRDN
jgi:hypothetical protein